MPAINYFEKEAVAKKRRTQELTLYGLACVILLTIELLCVWVIVRNGLANDQRKLAWSLLITLVWALLGYTAGKSAK